MCGFIAGKDLDADLNQVIEHMNYRGLPGYKGYKKLGPFQFAHYSLPFVNLDPAVCVQPIDSEPPSLFVGEIFNYADLGYKTDIECSIEEFWNDTHTLFNRFHKFDGFWSFVTLYNGSLIAATDYLAQKPVYYRTDMEAIASEIDVLADLGAITADETFMSNTLKWGYSPDTRTPWNEIKQVPPGHYYYKGNVHSYWDWDKVPWTTSLHHDLVTATELRLGGQREVAVLLSGGLDSTIIHNIITKHLNRSVTAIHVDNGERDFAHLVNPNAVQVTLDDVSDFEALLTHQTPVDLGSVKPQIAMAKKLAQLGFHAVLTGDGADELFGGYRRAKEYDSQHSDMFCELPYYHMPKIDRTMMRHTIETRSPFLSPAVCKHALNTPYAKRMGEKVVLKETFKELVPQKILERDKLPLKTEAIRTNPMDNRKYLDSLWRTLRFTD